MHTTTKPVVNAPLELLVSPSVTEVLASQPSFRFLKSCSRDLSLRWMFSQRPVKFSLWRAHWKFSTLAQYCVEKNTLSGALLNPVLRRMIAPSVREWTLSISCQWEKVSSEYSYKTLFSVPEIFLQHVSPMLNSGPKITDQLLETHELSSLTDRSTSLMWLC